MVSSDAIAAWLSEPSAEVSEDIESQRRLLSDPRLRPAMRACIGPICLGRWRFWSAHAGNRICPTCREAIARHYGIVLPDGSDAP